MKEIIIAYPVKDVAMQLRSVLEANDLHVSYICGTGSSVLRYASNLRSGVVICSSLFSDMGANTIAENLSVDFDVIALSKSGRENYMGNLVSLPMPVDIPELIDLVRILARSQTSFTKRSGNDGEDISNAKLILMDMNNMTEMQAHKYLQQQSMKTGKKIADIAREILKQYS